MVRAIARVGPFRRRRHAEPLLAVASGASLFAGSANVAAQETCASMPPTGNEMTQHTSQAPLLSLKGLSKQFGGAGWVLRDLSLDVRPGELLCVLGPSGCGKTTFLRLIAGFEAPDAGEILCGEEVISGPGWALPPEKRRMGMVFQEPTLFPHLTVRENVQFGLRARERNGGQTLAAPAQSLVGLMALCGLAEWTERYPHELSGGQQQRVALARALAIRPHLVLLDEPFSSLDNTLRRALREEVRRVLKESGATGILVTHDHEEAFDLGDRLAILNGGALEQVGTPQEVLERPATPFVAGFLGFTDFLPGHVRGSGVETPLGRFPLAVTGPDAPGAHPDGPVRLMLRPRHWRPVEAGGISATVLLRRYLGGQPIYRLRLPGDMEAWAYLEGIPAPDAGDTVRVALDPTPLVCFPG